MVHLGATLNATPVPLEKETLLAFLACLNPIQTVAGKAVIVGHRVRTDLGHHDSLLATACEEHSPQESLVTIHCC